MKVFLGLRFVATACLLLFPAWCFGWNSTGHQIVALIAWQQLSPEQQTSASELLKHLPGYEQDIGRRVSQLSPDQQPAAIFAIASTWPDIVREPSTDIHRREHKPVWHYVDIPIIKEGAKLPQPPEEPKFTRDADEKTTNIVQALLEQSDILTSETALLERRAVALAWLLHLTGDLHQPLHTSAMFSELYPRGDAGGNYFLVCDKDKNTTEKLHSLWDGLLGEQMPFLEIQTRATALLADETRSSSTLAERINIMDFKRWTYEGHEVARHEVYRVDTPNPLQGTSNRTGLPAPYLPDDYMERGREVAKTQAAVAGYRLAKLLKPMIK